MAKKEMTFEDAREILSKGDLSDPRFVAALNYMESNYPNNPLYLEKKAEYNAAHGKAVDDAYIYEANMNALNVLSLQYEYKDFKEEHEDILSRISVRSDDGKISVLASEATKDEYIENDIFEVAKEKARMSLVGDKAFHSSKNEEKKEKYEERVKDFAMTDLCRVAAASEIEAPTEQEMELGSEASNKYLQRVRAKAAEVFDNLFKTKKKVTINADLLSTNVADYAWQVDEFAAKLKQKARKLKEESRNKLNSIVAGFAKRKQKIEKKADKVSNGRYSKITKVFKENKAQIVGNTVATIALSMSGYGTVALVAYGAYMAASAWVFPARKKMQEMRAKKREKVGKPATAKERFAETMKLWNRAFRQLWNDPKSKRKALITTGIAIVSFGALAKYASAINLEMVEKGSAAAVAGVRKAFSWVRMGVANLVQATETGITGVTALKNKGDVNAKKEFGSALKGFVIGLGASAATLGARDLFEKIGLTEKINNWVHDLSSKKGPNTEILSSDRQVATVAGDEAEKSGGIREWLRGLTHKKPRVAETVMAEQAVKDTSLVAQTDSTLVDGGQDAQLAADEVINTAQFERFPTNWEDISPEDRGSVTLARYTRDMRYINNGKISDIDPQSLDRAWMNMDEEFMSHFPGKTKMEAFLEVVELDRFKHREQFILGNESFKFTDLNGEQQQGFYINTPMGKQAITDEGVIAEAKDALAHGEKVSIARLHGRAFLRDQFELLGAEGMNDEQMSQVVEIAMHTYDPNQVSGAMAQVRELCPDLTKAELGKVREIIDYNRRYEEDGETMEKLWKAIGCGDKDAVDYDDANKFLDRTDEILHSGHRNAYPTSQTVGCPGSTMHRHGAPVSQPKLPVLDDNIEIVDDDFVIEDDDIKLDDDLKVNLFEKKVVEQPCGNEGGGEHDAEDYIITDGGRSIPNSEAEAAIKKQARIQNANVIQRVVNSLTGKGNGNG